jgi:hypothetical protein
MSTTTFLSLGLLIIFILGALIIYAFITTIGKEKKDSIIRNYYFEHFQTQSLLQEDFNKLRAEHKELYLDFVKIKGIVEKLPCAANGSEKSERMEYAKEKLHDLLATVFKDKHHISHQVVSINADNPEKLAAECKKLPKSVLVDILESMEQKELYKAAAIVRNEIAIRD